MLKDLVTNAPETLIFSGFRIITSKLKNIKLSSKEIGRPIEHHFPNVISTPFSSKISNTRMFAGVPAGDINPPIPAQAGIVYINDLANPEVFLSSFKLFNAVAARAVNNVHVARLETNPEKIVTQSPKQ